MHVTHTRQSRHGWHDILALPTKVNNNLIIDTKHAAYEDTCRLTFVETL